MDNTLHIVLIDDDEDDKLLFQEALEDISRHAQLNYFNNGPDAIHWLVKTTVLPQYIFLDLNMPRMNGKETLAEIKKHKYLHTVPVIVYSTSNSDAEKHECKLLGAALYVTKPYKFSELKSVIMKVFDVVKQP